MGSITLNLNFIFIFLCNGLWVCKFMSVKVYYLPLVYVIISDEELRLSLIVIIDLEFYLSRVFWFYLFLLVIVSTSV